MLISRLVSSCAARRLARRALSSSGSAAGAYETILFERRGAVGLITLNRPKVNALSSTLVAEVARCAASADADPDVGALVITGNDKFFAAGADIAEMSTKSYMEIYRAAMFSELEGLGKVRKPIVAAVNGYALGGGCELAMACDFIIAGDTAVFGQPEIKLGTIPGLGGTQRFTRALGKARAMELVLTGDTLSAEEAVARGLASRMVPAASLLDEALASASKMAALSRPIVALAKASVNAAFEGSLAEGLRFERHLFYSTFGTRDQKVGMKAFIEKSAPCWTHE
ncbi:hypothetical protein KFE25_003269 [Diacronema lutheri]|nr:hypothetical protein KFE25_003269 [Diacronema lutheri]